MPKLWITWFTKFIRNRNYSWQRCFDCFKPIIKNTFNCYIPISNLHCFCDSHAWYIQKLSNTYRHYTHIPVSSGTPHKNKIWNSNLFYSFCKNGSCLEIINSFKTRITEKNSFIRWAVSQGLTVFCISWVNPDEQLAQKTFEDYMLDGPVAAIGAAWQPLG